MHALADIARGRDVLRALGRFDIGQAAVVIDGHVVGVEDIEGTDGLLARVARLRAEGRIRAATARGVLVKAPKSGQDLRFDLPTMGPRTVEGAAAARLAGIAIVAGNTIVADPQAMIEAADAGPFRDRSARVTPARATADVARKIFLIATEESGDRLGASLMKVLRQRLGGAVRFDGVGGRSMAREGLSSLFPIEELSIIGLAAIAKRLPTILRRIRQTADAVTDASADILVIIDSPDFTHRVARRVRARDPAIPIIDYVSPSVWAWRPGRARAMRAYVDHVLALLPFEPEEYRQIARPALQLCRSSPGRADRHAAAPARGATATGPAAAGSAGAARKPAQRDPASSGDIRRDARPAARAGCRVRTGPSDHAASASRRSARA